MRRVSDWIFGLALLGIAVWLLGISCQAALNAWENPSPVLRVSDRNSIIVMGREPECTGEQIRAIVDWTLRCMGVKEQRVPIVIVVHAGEVLRLSTQARKAFEIEGRQYCSLPSNERAGFPFPGPGWVLEERLTVYGVAQSDLVSGAPAVVHVAEDLGALVHELAHVAPHIGGDWGRMALHGRPGDPPEKLTIEKCDYIVIDCRVSDIRWP